MEITTILSELTGVYGPSGREGKVAGAIVRYIEKLGHLSKIDPAGNVVCKVGDVGKKVVFAAHMDTIGLMLTRIDKDGYGYFTSVGWHDAGMIAHSMVIFENSTQAAVCVKEDKTGKELKLTDLYLDFGTKTRVETEEKVSVGDIAVFCRQYTELGNRICGTYLDNRAGCAVLLSAIENIKEPKNQVYFLFTTQEETGTGGAGPGCYGIDGAIGIAVDVTAVDDVPGSSHEGTATLGKGAAVKILDKSALSSPEVVKKMTTVAGEKSIPNQKDILTGGATDAGAMSGVRSGMLVGGVSIPCRYTHSPTELMDKNDLKACADLVIALAETEF